MARHRRTRMDRAYVSYQHLAALDPLRYMGSNFVRGDGPVPCRLMVIGEAPGAKEDEQKKPFVGPSGQILIKALEDIGVERGDVFITNVLKYRPPKNRDPLPAEAEASRDCLRTEITMVGPELVVLCGKYALQAVFPNTHISKEQGKARMFRGRWWLPTYHPAFAARNKVAHGHFIDAIYQIPEFI